jgi:putative hemolysin
VLIEVAVVLLLTILNGALAMSELAVVSARPARLRARADAGSRGAATALELAADPGRFLSAVQIGITLVGILAGAFSGATLGARLAAWLREAGLSATLADTLGVGLVVVAITYLSLVVGELVPKQIALRDPEGVAARVAPAMKLLSRLAAPVVWLLDASGELLLWLLGQAGERETQVSEEEVRGVMAEAENVGVLKSREHDMLEGVMRLADRSARAVMTPRVDVEVLDLAAGSEATMARIRSTRHTRLPVRDGEPDEIVGVIAVKDALASADSADVRDLRSLVQEAPVVLDGADALQVIDQLRRSTAHMALVFDEYGHFEGIVTAMDVLEAITGAFLDEGEDEPAIVRRADGSLLVAGSMPVDEFAAELGVTLEADRDYETVAGLVLTRLGRFPELGECFESDGLSFEVVDLDGRRIDKVLIMRKQATR